MIKVVKFGGTSLADSEQIKKACDIVRADDTRRFFVASAPGKRFKEDIKVTDLLYQCFALAAESKPFDEVLDQIKDRYQTIIDGLGVSFPLDDEIEEIRTHLNEKPEKEYTASRGEYLNAKIIAKYLGRPFFDAKDLILFDEHHKLNEADTYRRIHRNLKDHAVIPGFYGAKADQTICTFSRGGSDITGALIARGLRADIYENWTDVSGMLTADPNIVKDPKPIEYVSYRELRELSYMGASVLHEDAVFPVKSAGIPIHICNTNRPDDRGTMIVPHGGDTNTNRVITGIAGKKGLSNIQIEKAMMNGEVGFGASVLGIIADYGISYEHTPTSIDTMSVLVSTAELDGVREDLLKEIDRTVHPDRVFIEDGIAILAIVGEGLVHHKGVAAELFKVIYEAGVNVRMVDVGFSELNIIVGVSEKEYEKTVRAVYEQMNRLM